MDVYKTRARGTKLWTQSRA